MVLYTAFLPNGIKKLIEVESHADIRFFSNSFLFAMSGDWTKLEHISWSKSYGQYVIISEMKVWSDFFGAWTDLRPNGVTDKFLQMAR